MKKNNTMSKGVYFFEHLLYILFGYVLYNNLLFERLNGKSHTESIAIFWGIIIIGCTVGYLLTYEKNRTWVNAFFNVLFCFSVYAVLSMLTILKTPIAIGLCVILILTVLLGYLVFGRKIRPGVNVGRVIRRRFCKWFLVSRVVFSVIMAVAVGVGLKSVVTNGNMLITKTKAVASSESTGEWSIKNKVDELRVLQEEEWAKLDLQEKLEVLQVVVNIDSNCLGIGHEVNIGARPLLENMNGETYGQYVAEKHTISLDTNLLQTAPVRSVLTTTFHEVRHVYQKRAVEALASVPEEYYNLYIFQDISGFERGFATYGDDSAEGYAQNKLEIDSRNYAKERVISFYNELEECLKTKEEKQNE